jgi:SAM-dependent methyltransferase
MGGGKKLTRSHWFEDLADHLSSAYLRYSFTKGTEQEVEFLLAQTNIAPGARILDVGCGPGRHSLEFARRGYEVVGIDISEEFVRVAQASAREEQLDRVTFSRMDARKLQDDGALNDSFDLVVCLCQGGFGLMLSPAEDLAVFAGLARALRPRGTLVLSAFNAYFQIRHHHEADFDAQTGVGHERTSVKNPAGEVREVDLWTGCYTPKELALLADREGLCELAIYGVEPGAYGQEAASVDLPELLLVARRPPTERW